MLRAIKPACLVGRLTCMPYPKRYQVLGGLPLVDSVLPLTKHVAQIRGWLPGKPWDYAVGYGNNIALAQYTLRVSHHAVAFERKVPGIDNRLFKCVPLAGLQPSGFHTKKCQDWPVENVVEWGRKILPIKPEAYLLLLGGSDDRANTKCIQAHFPNRSIDLAGHFSLREATAIMRYLTLYASEITLEQVWGRMREALQHLKVPEAAKQHAHPAY